LGYARCKVDKQLDAVSNYHSATYDIYPTDNLWREPVPKDTQNGGYAHKSQKGRKHYAYGKMPSFIRRKGRAKSPEQHRAVDNGLRVQPCYHTSVRYYFGKLKELLPFPANPSWFIIRDASTLA
jgi:hypothetical protein